MTEDRDQYMDPANRSQLRERQDAAFAELEEELCLRNSAGSRWSPELPKPPPAASAAPKLRPLQVGILRVSSDAHAPASASPFCMPEAQLFSPPASPSRRKQRTRRHKLDNVTQLPVVSYNDNFSPASLDINNNRLTPDPVDVSLLDDDIDWENFFCSAPSELGNDNVFETVNSISTRPRKTVKHCGREAEFIFDRSVFVDPVEVPFEPAQAKTVFSEHNSPSTRVSSPRAARARLFSAPVSVPRVEKAEVQLVPTPASRPAEALSVPAPVPAPRVGAAAAQPLPVPVPAPRVRAAVTQLPPTPVPTPRVGAAPVSQIPAPVSVSTVSSSESVLSYSSCSEGSEELAQPPSQVPSLQQSLQHVLQSLAQSFALLVAQSLAQSPVSTLAQSPVSTLAQSPVSTLAQSPVSTLAQSPVSPLAQSPVSQLPVAQPLGLSSAATFAPEPLVQFPVQSPTPPTTPLSPQPSLQPLVQSPVPVQSPLAQLSTQPPAPLSSPPLVAQLPVSPVAQSSGPLNIQPGVPIPSGSTSTLAGSSDELIQHPVAPTPPPAFSAGGPEEPVNPDSILPRWLEGPRSPSSPKTHQLEVRENLASFRPRRLEGPRSPSSQPQLRPRLQPQLRPRLARPLHGTRPILFRLAPAGRFPGLQLGVMAVEAGLLRETVAAAGITADLRICSVAATDFHVAGLPNCLPVAAAAVCTVGLQNCLPVAAAAVCMVGPLTCVGSCVADLRVDPLNFSWTLEL
ncbi:proline-rich protein 36-like [Oreochromis niloticus]|uniref:proline-rich protein 36-like n=1 Tax=Oreochromis niloticus TaxID=8128 RepID=UPI000DF11F45|nr:proline-rich protein 36-like [Oreochromis niloticus]